jgi:hypothetical protein
MTTDWKHALGRIAGAIGRGLLLLGRHLLALFVMAGRFVVLRAAPAIRAWLRDAASPALRRLYLHLPHRRVVAALGILALVVAGLLLFRPSQPVAEEAFDRDRPIRVAAHETRLVDQLLSDDWDRQKAATRTALESMGVVILDDDAPFPTADGLYVTSPELVALAMDGARKARGGRITLAELASMLADLGFPFPEKQHPSVVMEAGIRAWVTDALENRGAPGAESALFLHAMAARQQPALDLSSTDWMAEQYKLTHLELFAFMVAVGNAFPDSAPPATPRSARAVDRIVDLLVPAAHAAGESTLCAPTRNHLDKGDFHDRNKKNMQSVFGLGQDWAGGEGGSAGMKGAAKALAALSTLFKLQKLMMLYGSIDMRVTADQSLVHKPARHEAGKEVLFTATVGMDEEKYREFQEKMNASTIGKSLKECLTSLGLPLPTDMDDIAGEMKNWAVSWDLSGAHATWTADKNDFPSNNQRRAPLTPISKRQGSSKFVVDIKPEDRHEGDIVTGYILGKATLHTDAMPGTEAVEGFQASFGTLTDGNVLAGLLGLAGTAIGVPGSVLAEVLGGATQRFLDPEVSYNVAVTYHRHRDPGYGYEGAVEAETSHHEEETGHETRGTPGKSGYVNLASSDVRQYHGRVVVKGMRPERMSYTRFTERKDTAYWDMSGDSDGAGSYSQFSSSAGQVGCAGVKAGMRDVSVIRMGSGSQSHGATYSMTIEQVGSLDDGYRIQLAFGDYGFLVPHETHTITHQGGGCEFLHGSDGEQAGWTTHGFRMTGFAHEYRVDAPYPKQISGDRSVENKDGSTTHWKWDFRRVGPIENPGAGTTRQ